MEIIELHGLADAQAANLLELMKELNPALTVSAEMLRATTGADGSHLFAWVSGDRIMGTATLCVFHSPTGCKGKIEDVVVASAYRGQGLGRQLVAHAMEYAREHYAPIELSLTSNPSREKANRLYRSLGFKPYETNVYKFEIQ